MNVTLHLHDEFKRQFRQLRKKYHSLTDDLEDFQKELIKNPFQGDDLGGGARILTLNVLVSDNADITLLTIYDKNEIDNVSDEYIRWLVNEVKKT